MNVPDAGDSDADGPALRTGVDGDDPVGAERAGVGIGGADGARGLDSGGAQPSATTTSRAAIDGWTLFVSRLLGAIPADHGAHRRFRIAVGTDYGRRDDLGSR